MKKLLALLLTILLLTIAFASCNLDGTAGIFRQISQAKAPLDIEYKQLLGIDAAFDPNLYVRTAEGIFRVPQSTTNTGTKTYVKESLVTSTFDNKIQAAAFSLADSKVFYFTNNTTEENNNTINLIDTGTKAKSTATASTAFISPSNIKINAMLPNGMILVKEKDETGKLFELLKYDGGILFNSSVYQFTLPSTGYGLHSLIQQSGHVQDKAATERSVLVTFVKSTSPGVGEYEHYLVRTTTANTFSTKSIGSNSISVANYIYDFTVNDNIYALSTNGKLYYVGTFTSPLASWTELYASGKFFNTNAFAYKTIDGTDYHFISKPSLKSSPLVVFTFDNTTTTSAGVSMTTVQSGYAKEISLATIISAHEKSTNPSKLLVATDTNGMFDISITDANANVDDSTNGDSLEAEQYSF